MPIQLDKILAKIAEEKSLHPNSINADSKDVDDAWARVAKTNNLSVHEARSIFKVLQKKYDQEKSKENPTWKLFALMDKIHTKALPKEEPKNDDAAMEEDDEYEMLEVQEEEDDVNTTAAGNAQPDATSDGESPSKSNSSMESPEKEDKPIAKTASQLLTAKTLNSSAAAKVAVSPIAAASEEKKAVVAATRAAQSPSVTAAALSKKGITMRKTNANLNSPSATRQTQTCVKVSPGRIPAHLEVGKTIQLPDSFKRKLSQEQSPVPQKKVHIQHIPTATPTTPRTAKTAANNSASPPQQHTTTAQLLQAKQEDKQAAVAGYSLITIPGANGIGGAPSSTAATIASSSSNGFSPRIEDIDFSNDIIFDAGSGLNGVKAEATQSKTGNEIVNLGNFDNSLPPTFFKNLCNSSRHEALGLYVANVMNRLRPRSAAKLELGILRAIIDVQSDELEQ